MVQMNLKRQYENNSCTHGILTIPAFGFRCFTLELRDGDEQTYKRDCRIPEGSYVLKRGFAQGWPSFPVFKKKPKGFAKKPEFNLSDGKYISLPAGDIALGSERLDDFSIRQSDELATAFKEIFQEVFLRKETVVLCVYKSKTYSHVDASYSQSLGKNYNFINTF